MAGRGPLLVLLAGLAVSAGYSLRPVRLADRGLVAALVLPACYVAVPFLVGLLAYGGDVRRSDLLVLAGLYVGFVGRILLKDFRDLRGDELFGKRTFLVRHGRAATCRLSAAFWTAGTGLVLAGLRPSSASFTAWYAATLVATLALLLALAVDRGPRRDETLISAVAIVGRAVMLVFSRICP
ncbi:MAG: UbiA family prenyltransferase [Actinomycetota bacterium]|nr:UbiA family prenyltransferase [Actinomycetota bacterium]